MRGRASGFAHRVDTVAEYQSVGAADLGALFVRSSRMSRITKFLRNNRAATAIEYGLIAALIAVAAITAMTNVGGGVKNTFNNVKNKL
jgi:pilus assembly protein Flp/PilA